MFDKVKQLSINGFGLNQKEYIQEEWVDMPEYDNVKNPEPEITATFKFRNENDYNEFKSLVQKHVYKGKRVFDGNQQIHKKHAWFPRLEKPSNYIYVNSEYHKPAFPIYIVSKGRYNRNPTSRALKEMQVDFYMIIEEQEFDQYSKLVDSKQLLVLPKKFQDEYDTFWEVKDGKTGVGAARNYAWQHSLDNGFDWHWVMDDNIECFERMNKNIKVKCSDGSIFCACEDFVSRYENVGQAGLQYANFMPYSDDRPPFKLNTRIYSCLLQNNHVKQRWRGRYNEDTDLSIRIMKDGWVTIQFNAFLQAKRATQTLKGGNTDEFYKDEGTLPKSQMLADMHPDICKVVERFNRDHHYVDYSVFQNKLIKKKDLNIRNRINNYGMELKKIK